jgi:pimeloyl-ACP methyl ester carboxylesterase
MPDLDTRLLASADGTPVEYLSVGRGPHVIVVPGALAIAADLTAFARLLAQRHTVHVMQRRGRGGSGPQGDRYGIARECEDIEAVRVRTGARLIVGHSFGGLAGRVPRRLLRVILRHAIPRAELQQNLALMPQAISEHAEVGRLDGRLADYREISAATLIMRGKGRSTGRQARTLARLADTIPHSQTVTFPKLDHFAPEKKPGEIADAVQRFFAAHSR